MDVLRFDIFLEQPLLVTDQVSDPNSVRSYDYIPGSTLRGLFAQRYLKKHQRANGAGLRARRIWVDRLLWRPSVAWAIGIALVAAVSILSLGQPTEFLYWQF